MDTNQPRQPVTMEQIIAGIASDQEFRGLVEKYVDEQKHPLLYEVSGLVQRASNEDRLDHPHRLQAAFDAAGWEVYVAPTNVDINGIITHGKDKGLRVNIADGWNGKLDDTVTHFSPDLASIALDMARSREIMLNITVDGVGEVGGIRADEFTSGVIDLDGDCMDGIEAPPSTPAGGAAPPPATTKKCVGGPAH